MQKELYYLTSTISYRRSLLFTPPTHDQRTNDVTLLEQREAEQVFSVTRLTRNNSKYYRVRFKYDENENT